MGVVIDSNTNSKDLWFSVTAKKWQFFHSISVKRFLNVIKYIDYRRTAILNDLCTFFSKSDSIIVRNS